MCDVVNPRSERQNTETRDNLFTWFEDDDFSPFEEIESAGLDFENRKTERAEFRENTWLLRKSRPKHKRPKVSAVSWIVNRVLSVYAWCQKVRENGASKER